MVYSLKPILKYTFKVTLVVLSWVPVLYLITENVCYFNKVEGFSMSPTLNPIKGQSDWVLVWKWDFRANLKVGDVILMRSPVDPEKLYTKRIKGIQGDEIITRYPYPKEKVTISRNHLWVEGDNIHSVDSNHFGPVSSLLATGKITHIIYPFKRFGALSDGGRECRESKLREID